MSHNSAKIPTWLEPFRGYELSANYLGYFACFNRQLFFEAHEVLEELWLPQRNGPKGAFYKGLIQLAGAFVHVQKNRPGPATALLRLAQSNLEKYPAQYEGLQISDVQNKISGWLQRVERGQLRVEEWVRLEPPSASVQPTVNPAGGLC